MRREQPEVSPTGRYTPAEAAGLLGIHRNTLARYAREGRIRFGVRKATGRRYYTGLEITRLWRQSL